MPDPQLDAVRQQMLKEGFTPDVIDRAFRDIATLTHQQQATPAPPSILSRFTSGLADIKTNVPARVKADLLKAGWPADRAEFQSQLIARKLQVVPTTPAGLAQTALPFLVGRAIPAGRTLSRIGGQLLGNIGGSAAIEGTRAALSGEDIIPATVEGAARGIPGGVLQAATGALLGPSKATLKTQRSQIGLEKALSPEVSKVLKQKTELNVKAGDLKTLYSRDTIAALERAAGSTLDAMEATLGKQTANQRFEFPSGAGPKSLLVTPGGPAKGAMIKVPFEEIRGEIKRLRNIGEAAFADPEKQFKAKQRASRIEQHLLQQLPPDLAETYRTTIHRFADDRGILRALKAVQKAQALPGGLNRADSPIVAEAIDLLQDTELSAEARAAAMGALAYSGHPFMALHFSRFGRAGGVIDPNKVKPPLGGSRANLFGSIAGAVGAAGASAVGGP